MAFTIRKRAIGIYRRIEFKRKQFAIELEDVMNANLFVRRHVLATGDASSSQQNYGETDKITRRRLNQQWR